MYNEGNTYNIVIVHEKNECVLVIVIFSLELEVSLYIYRLFFTHMGVCLSKTLVIEIMPH